VTGDLFGSSLPEATPAGPLADRMRPQSFEELVGQEHLFEPGSPLALVRDGQHLSSMVLWGPPGSGKTTIARLIARTANAPFVAFIAVLTGVKEVKETMARAALERRRTGRATVLFIDEIHRFNKAQQDAFLAHVERGDIVLIGATTENPSFEVNAALLSRARVVVLKELGPLDLRRLIERAVTDPRGLAERVVVTPRSPRRWRRPPTGMPGVRSTPSRSPPPRPGAPHVGHGVAAFGRRGRAGTLGAQASALRPGGEEHYNLISALHHVAARFRPARADSIGWRACWRPVRTRSTSRDGWSVRQRGCGQRGPSGLDAFGGCVPGLPPARNP
jgi:putative ATPase